MDDREKTRMWAMLDALNGARSETSARIESLEARFDRVERKNGEVLAAIREDLRALSHELRTVRDVEQQQAGAREAHTRWAKWIVAVAGLLVAAGYFGKEVGAVPHFTPPTAPPGIAACAPPVTIVI